MRYGTPVYFQRFTPPRYDPSTGDYVEGPVEESMRYASVMNTGTERIMQVYGQMKQGSLTIQLQNHYDCPFDRIRVGNTVYQADSSRKLRTKHTFIVSEVQRDAKSKNCGN